ncbi:exodeoxyribonuclease V subunit beta [Vibrio sp. SM6]|uniref:RecBCD enzyme subunit RecB n=1 Tax=Vibrio agarilyticus TaxID=2726741 RepID=A0A7X8YH55_9VIBR|nr:exodeoxyribonuclease V subunit beta [Vibrio agarilyticus]NLS13106.1 exodeoxyribonuclease V subunit beta [Vibrio agarilyticus]
MTQPTALDTMTFPLHGARLIEASAGTGKTFTIAGLYLRLLLGHGTDASRHAAPLTVEQILVVTFTEAATAELRERIRARIHDARLAFARGVSDDPVLKPLLSEISDHADAAQLLLQAERQMDEAAVYTIHGFCQRMLTQNAFESGARFNNEFITDEGRLKAQVVADYWRRQFYPLPLALAAEVRALWSSPSALLAKIGPYLSGSPLTMTTAPMQGELSQLHQDNLAKIDQLKTLWRSGESDYLSLIEQSNINKRSYSKKSLPNWLEAVNRWAESETRDYHFPDALTRFSQSALNEKTPSGEAPEHAAFVAIEHFLAQPISLEAPLLAHAISHCRDALAKAKAQKHWLSFDDLLSQLSAAIDLESDGTLTNRIRTLYPVAMIDEFQDTDPLQYSIFSRIYLPDPQSALLMIGDPKQAIYGFRGADIFTYIKARNQVSAHYTLGTNWRSSDAMVGAVNQIFATATNPFIYDNDIPFYPVNSSPKAASRYWRSHDVAQPALTYWLDESLDAPQSKSDYLTQMAEACASQIHSILSAAQQGNAHFIDGETQREISAGDIAVLVRTGSEGQRIQRALFEQGIASVYLSNRDSVFSSAVAQDVQRLLQAVLTPENERALRACLASELFALDAASLDALNNDELAWESALAEIKEYRKLWQQRGVLPMLRAVMSKRHIAERLLASEGGERALTDLMHIGELLQQASNELDSDHALLRWLAQAVSDAEQGVGGSDEQIQRLESERNLVQIVTIHKSKGLEYDLVMLPFVMSYRQAQEAKYYDATQDCTLLDITAPTEALALADKERLAEDLRLLYVALTRAVYGCFIGTAPLRLGRAKTEPTGAHLSAMGYLLQNGQEGGVATFCQAIATQCSINAAGAHADVIQSMPPTNQLAPFQAKTAPHTPLVAAELSARIDRSWRITSYSGLVKSSHSQGDSLTPTPLALDGILALEGIASASFDIDAFNATSLSPANRAIEQEAELRPFETNPVAFNDNNSDNETRAMFDIAPASSGAEELSGAKEASGITEPSPTIFDFPRGATPGTFLHTLFEQIEFSQSASDESNRAIIDEQLALAQFDPQWQGVLAAQIDTVLATPLDGKSLQLNQLTPAQRLVEMEFLLPVEVLQAGEFNRLAQRFDPLSARAGDLGFQTVHGMLKGFIDLVFEHQGRYYVLDWKSNHLGDSVAAYHRDALEQAMADHRYDLQYQLYALALHRFLRSRLQDYDYSRHFGGVYYLFLRGMDGSSDHGVFYAKPSETFIDQLDALIQGDVLPPRHTDAGQMELL